MTQYVERQGLKVAAELASLVENGILKSVTPSRFWAGYESMLRELMPINSRLLAKREDFQLQIDHWHRSHPGNFNQQDYTKFLLDIGYLLPEADAVTINVKNVDHEIASIAGPQLVVPVSNARFALNAANARWGSLYDALYGTDAIPGEAEAKAYDPSRGALVIAWVRNHLDKVAPLVAGSWSDVTGFSISNGVLSVRSETGDTTLADGCQFAGYRKTGDVILRVNGLLIDLVVDATSVIGSSDKANISDVRVESALTAIQDCEDSVAAVDAADKCAVYANWLGLMSGELTETFTKNGRLLTRELASDMIYLDPDGNEVRRSGRALLLARNVGHLMTTDAVMLDGQETPEGIMDAIMTVAAAVHDLDRPQETRNSAAGSVYIVKPKMHGPEEVAFANRLYGCVEDILGLPRNTVKLGIMDEERRTSANLMACIAEVRERCVFINTGFLDRTGDEIHTSMHAGPVVPRSDMQQAGWLKAYENGNVDTGLAAGFEGTAQIGKGMWAKPDAMNDMLGAKINHPKSGANTAWVPSPTAATLHATHYHKVDVRVAQSELKHREKASRVELLTPPIMSGKNIAPDTVRLEIDNACQSILGYVVRWVDQGIGCSKVPDIHDVALMEDRATLRISAQYLANWILHGICSVEDVEASFRRMAPKVDAQNSGDPKYRPMAPGFDGVAFNAARDLVIKGCSQPSGYTEPLLHAARRAVKDAA